MPIDDLQQFGKNQFECGPISRAFHVTIDGMKKPKARVGRMVKTIVLSLRKHVRYQPILHVMGKRPQYPASFCEAPGSQRQSFEADHGVAAPIREPVIT